MMSHRQVVVCWTPAACAAPLSLHFRPACRPTSRSLPPRCISCAAAHRYKPDSAVVAEMGELAQMKYGKKVVGWYHTHPNFPAKPSDYGERNLQIDFTVWWEGILRRALPVDG